MLLFQIPLSWIRDIRKLTITNLIANILILYGLIACLGFAISTAARSDVGRGPLEEIGYKFSHLDQLKSGWFLFIGTSVRVFSLAEYALYVITSDQCMAMHICRFCCLKVPSHCSFLFKSLLIQLHNVLPSPLCTKMWSLESSCFMHSLVSLVGCPLETTSGQ